MTKNSKKTRNKKSKAKGPVAQQMGRSSYFESERLARLPMGDSFLSTAEENDVPYVHVAITRRHTNGHICYAIFGIAADVGDLYEVLYDFNTPTEAFDDLMDYMQFEPYNDLNALEQLIHDAELSSKTSGYKIPADHHIARRILSNKMDTGWREISHEKLALFQTMSTENTPSEQEQKQQDEEAAKGFASFEATVYEPGIVRQWNHADWDQFLLEMDQFASTDILDVGFTPLAYLFETNLLQNYPASAPLLSAFNRLKSMQPRMSSTALPITYQPSSYEILMENALALAIDSKSVQEYPKKYIASLQDLIKQYPDNPEFYHQLYQLYEENDLEEDTFALAVDNYQRFPLMDFAFTGYLTTIFFQNKQNLIDAFFKKGYLIEDHYPEDFVFFDRHYQFYYLTLGQYLANEQEFQALWILYDIISRTELYQRSKLFQKGWQDVLFKAISKIVILLLEGTNQEREALIQNALSTKNQ